METNTKIHQQYIQGELPELPTIFEAIIKSLDQEREIAYNKTKGIKESGLAQKIHRDIMFINQLTNELSLIDKANG